MKNMIPKDTRSPTFTAALLTAAETQTWENVHRQIKENVATYIVGYSSSMRSYHWNYEIMPSGTERMDLGASYTKWSQLETEEDKITYLLQAKF